MRRPPKCCASTAWTNENQGLRFSGQPGFRREEGYGGPRNYRPRHAYKILYIINTGKKKCGKAIDRLLEIPNTHLTITVGRDAELKEKTVAADEGFRRAGARPGLDQPNAAPDVDASPGHYQGGRGDGAGSHRRPLPDDLEPGHPRPGRRQRAAWSSNPDVGVVAEKNRKWPNGWPRRLPAIARSGGAGAII
jgi:hypothetical protein